MLLAIFLLSLYASFYFRMTFTASYERKREKEKGGKCEGKKWTHGKQVVNVFEKQCCKVIF